jgi:fucose permease
VLLHLDFVLTGVVMTLLGPMLPVLTRRWLLDDTQAGYLFIAQWTTSIAGMLASGTLVERHGYRRTLIAGLIPMAAGMATLARANWWLGLVSVCALGAGAGITTPAANLLIADANPNKRAAALNLLNSSWGVGAMGCPFLVAAMQRSLNTALFLYSVAIALVVLAFVLASARFPFDLGPRVGRLAGREAGYSPHRVLVAAVCILFFIYVGTETSVGGWIASYARRIDPRAASFWAVTPSFFWGAMLLGRATAPLGLRQMRAVSMATAGVSLALVGIILLLFARTMSPLVLGASLAGLGLSSVYPISVSLLTQWFGRAAVRVSGAIFAIGNLGGAVLPWLVGLLSTRSGSLRLGFVVPLVGAMSMLVFYLLESRFSAKLAAPAAPVAPAAGS